MKVTDTGVPVDSLITAVKQAVKRAGVSQSSASRDLQIKSVELILKTVAARTVGGELDFRIPLIGMKIRAGGKVSSRDTHSITMTLVPPDRPGRRVTRSRDVEQTLVDAIETIRKTMAAAAAGDDPWVISASAVDIIFGVTKSGSISVGADGELAGEVTQTLRLGLIAPSGPS